GLTRGILPAHVLEDYCAKGLIRAARPLDVDQVQPASLDLRLGECAWRVRASFLPGPKATVAQRLATLAFHKVPLGDGAVLETGCVYIVPALASDEIIALLHQSEGLISGDAANIDKGLALSVDLAGSAAGEPVGFRAKRHSGLIDIDRKAALDVLDYWEPISQQGSLVLDP